MQGYIPTYENLQQALKESGEQVTRLMLMNAELREALESIVSHLEDRDGSPVVYSIAKRALKK